MAYRNYSPANGFIVSKNGTGDFTTISAAISAASSGQTIFIEDGTYTENLTLKVGVDLTAFIADAYEPNVIINGTCTLTGAGTVAISGVQLQTNSAYALAVTGSAASVVNLINCYINCPNNTGINFTSSSSSAQINLTGCQGNLGTTGISIWSNSSTGTMTLKYCNFFNSGLSTSPNTCSGGGGINLSYCGFFNPFTFSSSSAATIEFTDIYGGLTNSIAVTTSDTSSVGFLQCRLTSGTDSTLSIGSGTSMVVYYVQIDSTNTDAITGAGTLEFGNVTFSNTSSTINSSTIVTKITEIGDLVLYTPLSPANGGTGVANNVASTLTISGNFASTFVMTAATDVTFPTSGTLATTSELPTLPLSAANGGTGANNAATLNSILSGNGTDFVPTATPILSSLTLPASGSSAGTVTTDTITVYEEGTWTPILGSTSGTPTVSYTTQTGVYQRIGNWVTLQFNIVVNGSVTGGSGNVRIKGMPYNGATNVATGVVALANITEISATVYTLQTTSSAAYLDIATSTSVTAQGFLPISAVETTANPSIQGTITFHV